MGGGRAGSLGSFDNESGKARPEDDEGERLWTTRTAIVTPGDRVEYKFTVKKGETLFAGATSDAFDPALSVVDPKGVEIAKNDDREEGDQAPFVSVRFPEDGTYLLRVLSYKSASGGKFILKTRTFTAFDARLGPATTEVGRDEDGDRRIVFRLDAKKGGVYDLRNPVGVERNGRYAMSFVRIVGPTGVGSADVEPIAVPFSGSVFLARASGDYYIEYRSVTATRIATDYREVKVATVGIAAEAKLSLEPGEVRLVEFPVVPDAIVRTTLTGGSTVSQVSAPDDPRTRSFASGDPTYGNTPAFSFYLLHYGETDDVVRLFHGTGTARVAIRSTEPKTMTVTVRNSETLPEWKAGDPMAGNLAIGEIRLYTLRSAKSELMKVVAKSPAFQAHLDIFGLNGNLANSLIDRRRNVAADDLYFPEADTFLVRLSCDGYGGSGPYTMRRDIPDALPYRLGDARTLTLTGSNFGLFSVDLEAGKRYELITDGTDRYLWVDLLDEDGQFLRSQAITLDGVLVQYFVPTRSGRHRLWLRGEAGDRRFTFRANVPPKIGGSGPGER